MVIRINGGDRMLVEICYDILTYGEGLPLGLIWDQFLFCLSLNSFRKIISWERRTYFVDGSSPLQDISLRIEGVKFVDGAVKVVSGI